jgi:hypothetical protein
MADSDRKDDSGSHMRDGLMDRGGARDNVTLLTIALNEKGSALTQSIAADGLLDVAQKSKDRETVERIAGALRGSRFTDHLRQVTVICRGMPLSGEDGKGMPKSSVPPARNSTGPQKLLRK